MAQVQRKLPIPADANGQIHSIAQAAGEKRIQKFLLTIGRAGAIENLSVTFSDLSTMKSKRPE